MLDQVHKNTLLELHQKSIQKSFFLQKYHLM